METEKDGNRKASFVLIKLDADLQRTVPSLLEEDSLMRQINGRNYRSNGSEYVTEKGENL